MRDTQNSKSDNSSEFDRYPASRKRRMGVELGPDFMFDYKDVTTLRYFITDRGRIIPKRVSGLSANQQRSLALAIKRARNIALLPYTSTATP